MTNQIFLIDSNISKIHSKFWLDKSRYTREIQNIRAEQFSTIDLVRLVTTRQSISNFVRFLTNKHIPVCFKPAGQNFTIDGKVVYISTNIIEPKDFDIAVGLALHEGSHVCKTNFDVLINMWRKVPVKLWKRFDDMNIPRKYSEKFIHMIWNVVEDRFVDDWAIRSSPGYIGYYKAMYDKYFNDPIVGFGLQHMYSYPSLESYKFRIINFINPNTNLYALPALYDVAKILNISNISRLEQTEDRMNIAFDMIDVILDNLILNIESSSCPTDTVSNYFSIYDGSESIPSQESSNNKYLEKSLGERSIIKIGNILSGNNAAIDDENFPIVHKIGDSENVTKTNKKKIDNYIQQQEKFLMGILEKQDISNNVFELLDMVENNKICITRVGNNLGIDKIECIVVNNLTKTLITAGPKIFPIGLFLKNSHNEDCGTAGHIAAVNLGLSYGNKLGQLLKIRTEVFDDICIRKSSGTLYYRLLHEAAWNSKHLFCKKYHHKYEKANIHISIDASSSMEIGNKWENTITCCVAICKATSMIDNIRTIVTFRTTQTSDSGKVIPYVVIAYDSNVDKISKIKKLFPMLGPSGWTPEGLAFEALYKISNMYISDEHDRYFINFSDGEPYMPISNNLVYANDIAMNHTRQQIFKLSKKNIQIISYFISQSHQSNNKLENNFKKMYGHRAQFINVGDIIPLAKTLNKLFINKS